MDKLGKIRRHHWKKRLKISKIAKFESDLFKTNEDTTAPQSREILQPFVWWGHKLAPHHQNVCKVSQLYGELNLRSLKTNHFQIWVFSFTNVRGLFPVVRRIFRNLSMSKVENTAKRFIRIVTWFRNNWFTFIFGKVYTQPFKRNQSI